MNKLDIHNSKNITRKLRNLKIQVDELDAHKIVRVPVWFK